MIGRHQLRATLTAPNPGWAAYFLKPLFLAQDMNTRRSLHCATAVDYRFQAFSSVSEYQNYAAGTGERLMWSAAVVWFLLWRHLFLTLVKGCMVRSWRDFIHALSGCLLMPLLVRVVLSWHEM